MTKEQKKQTLQIRALPIHQQTGLPDRVHNLLSRKQQSKLQAIASVLEYDRADSMIFVEGEAGQFVYSVAAGVVRLGRHAEHGKRQVLALMFPGDFFGLAECGKYVNSAETVCPSILYRVPWQPLMELMRDDPDLQMALLTRAAFDLRQAQQRIMSLAQHNAVQKLASFLLDIMQYPELYDEKKRQLLLPITRFDLGDYLGIAPETAARAFAQLEHRGILRRVSSRKMEIEDLSALKQLVHGRRRNSN